MYSGLGYLVVPGFHVLSEETLLALSCNVSHFRTHCIKTFSNLPEAAA